MDDFVHSFQSTEDAQLCVSDLKSTLQNGGFNLTKFLTDELNALEMLESELIKSETENHRVPGLLRNSPSDIISHKKLSKIDQDAAQYTLRKMLPLIAFLFDPLGIIVPIIITLKRILQDTWKEGLLWDDLLSTSKGQQIQDSIDKYLDTPQIQVPRSLSHSAISSGTNQLHVFCDASQLAYVAVIYGVLPEDVNVLWFSPPEFLKHPEKKLKQRTKQRTRYDALDTKQRTSRSNALDTTDFSTETCFQP